MGLEDAEVIELEEDGLYKIFTIHYPTGLYVQLAYDNLKNKKPNHSVLKAKAKAKSWQTLTKMVEGLEEEGE